ncbi:FMN-dependent oxidoreductase (nitrilotriacetate monooxygenase family) [Sphingobium sp. OAS761]|uniref:LLM class flavin-dependent oxidoreductase n=1 Tax=Sphingobium sp. OAS761 TaxID=2817901 RepID=UPI00209EF15B|nr:LLM class flavin-dependent oxidoreductase [Sphingobium sp. OAS761]MCP1468602.1 FMN-dependent oxidoreductase (nitrilotriacetate monooxygenase family) [Sphingobium sp. OAS761]
MAQKQIVLGALDCFAPGFLAQGMWAHPADRTGDFNSLSYWTDYARLLERGLFDMLFLADTIGVYDVYGGSRDPALRLGVQVPINDPFVLIAALAGATSNLGLAATGNLLYEPPYLFARRLSTLDHLTGGRVGWNIVTGILASGARAFGRDLMGHDDRYDFGDEFMEIVYRLWEHSWEDGAVVQDRERPMFTDPDKVHQVAYAGRHLKMSGIHLTAPSPQRTPLLFQAGASGRGKQFAARHAECMFVNGTSRASLSRAVADMHRALAEQGRTPDQVRILAGLTVIVGETRAHARDKQEAFKAAASAEATLVHASGGLGIDLSRYPYDSEIEYSETDANRTLMDNLTRQPDGSRITIRQVAEKMSLSSRNMLIVGDAQTVADEMIAVVAETGIDGFNLARVLMPDSLEDFVRLVVPRLQEKGAYKAAYRSGTLREKLGLGDGARLAANHYGRHAGEEAVASI